MQTKYIFVTGGVLSGLGKGVVAASIGRLLKNGRKVIPIKCDGYLNVDPGTLNPYEHGEVFVLKDGAEVDLDFGHYERFLHVDCKKEFSITSGKVFLDLVEKERRGDFLGKTVQVIPHVTGQIRQRWKDIATQENADILLIEIGGTVGDIESLWFLEAAREMLKNEGKKNCMFVHLGYIPEIDGQQKTKPMQQSLVFLRERGIFPDILVGRSAQKLSESTKKKLQWLTNIDMVISDPDMKFTYELPLLFKEEGLPQFIEERLNIPYTNSLEKWTQQVENLRNATEEITIAICGKYTDVVDSYISVQEALVHAGAAQNVKIHIKYVGTEDTAYNKSTIANTLEGCDAVIVPGGFGTRGIEGKINIIRYCREEKLPFLGICLGLQLAVVEYARNMCSISDASSEEFEIQGTNVIAILEEQKKITQKGATMRLGAYEAILAADSKTAILYDSTIVSERHRHRFEVNPKYHHVLESNGLGLVGKNKEETLVEFIELANHPYFHATQAHPELQSSLEEPAPLFLGLVTAAKKQKE